MDELIENGFADAIGFGQQFPPVPSGIPGSVSAMQPIEDTATAFENLRWYLVSNFRQLLSQLYVEIGLVKTIVNVPVDDALRGGVLIKSKQLDEEEISLLRKNADRDGDIITAGWGAKWNRLFGGAGIVIMVSDQDPEEPLDIAAIQKGTEVTFRAVDMWELFWDKQNLEGFNPAVQEEEFEHYNYYGESLHKSRVIKIQGLEAPSFIRPRLRGWGLSVVEDLIRSMNQYLKSTDLSFEVLDEFKLDVYKIKNLVNILASPTGTTKVKERVQMANWQKNYQNALVMDSEDDFDHKQLSFSGLADAQKEIRMQVAADMRMPITKLFGTSVSGGFATDQNDMENYNAMVESDVRAKIKYPILQMLEIKCQVLFGYIPDDLEIEFHPLRELTAVDQETVKTQKFQRIEAARQGGNITQEEYRDACNKGALFDIELDNSDSVLRELESEASEASEQEEKGEKEDDV